MEAADGFLNLIGGFAFSFAFILFNVDPPSGVKALSNPWKDGISTAAVVVAVIHNDSFVPKHISLVAG